MAMLDSIIERAKAKRARVVFPESDSPNIHAAAQEIVRLGLAEVLLLPSEALPDTFAQPGLSIVEPSTLLDQYAQHYLENRGKGSLATARRAITKPLYFGAMMVECGDADVMVAGIANPTRRVIQAAQLCIGAQDGVATPSSFFIMSFADRPPLVFADCAVNVDPNAEQLADIAIASADSAEKLLGDKPKVALLSFSSKGSADHPKAKKVAAALQIIQTHRPDLEVDGELQADAALVESVAAQKLSEKGAVAGNANVLIFPDLDSGNIAYKLVQHLAKADAFGPILQGFAKPVADLSRGASVEDVVAVTAATIALSF